MRMRELSDLLFSDENQKGFYFFIDYSICNEIRF